MTELLISIPVYNEATRIGNTVKVVVDYFKKHEVDFKLILSVDPSHDDSEIICDQIALEYDRVEVVHSPVRRGRGYAVRMTWLSYDSEYYSFLDADLSSDEKTLFQAFQMAKGNCCNILIGSRYYNGSSTTRPPLRKVVSFSYNKLLNFVFDEKIKDHQCGLKIIDRATRDILLAETKVNSWFWDTELLVLGVKLGFRVFEVPVKWIENKFNRTPLWRLFNDLLVHGWGIILLYKRIRNMNSSDTFSRPSDVNST